VEEDMYLVKDGFTTGTMRDNTFSWRTTYVGVTITCNAGNIALEGDIGCISEKRIHELGHKGMKENEGAKKAGAWSYLLSYHMRSIRSLIVIVILHGA